MTVLTVGVAWVVAREHAAGVGKRMSLTGDIERGDGRARVASTPTDGSALAQWRKSRRCESALTAASPRSRIIFGPPLLKG